MVQKRDTILHFLQQRIGYLRILSDTFGLAGLSKIALTGFHRTISEGKLIYDILNNAGEIDYALCARINMFLDGGVNLIGSVVYRKLP